MGGSRPGSTLKYLGLERRKSDSPVRVGSKGADISSRLPSSLDTPRGVYNRHCTNLFTVRGIPQSSLDTGVDDEADPGPSARVPVVCLRLPSGPRVGGKTSEDVGLAEDGLLPPTLSGPPSYVPTPPSRPRPRDQGPSTTLYPSTGTVSLHQGTKGNIPSHGDPEVAHDPPPPCEFSGRLFTGPVGVRGSPGTRPDSRGPPRSSTVPPPPPPRHVPRPLSSTGPPPARHVPRPLVPVHPCVRHSHCSPEPRSPKNPQGRLLE